VQADTAEGIIGWLAWCTLQACDRRNLPKEERDRLLLDYSSLFNEAVAEARTHLLMGPFPDLPETARGAIESRLEACILDFDRRSRELQDDFLFPAFKAPLSRDRAERILRDFRSPELYPTADEPRGLLVRAEEAYVASALATASFLDDHFLFRILIETTEPDILQEKWDGFDLPCSFGADGHWPALVIMRFSGVPTTNKVQR